ncbi:MAG TPA: LacI family transcriptional regulator, partial [Armatimonadetes bacterium]|nr:LacI family transcriptional regulator [Armatimonadota bacterium]
ALAEAGITDEMVVVQPEDPPQGAYLAAQTLLRERPDVQGVFCHSDLTAVGVIKALRDHGKRIPEDVAVVGFDNEPWTEFHQPSITTVSHPIEQLCSLSMSVLRSRLEGNAEPWCRIVLHPGLVIRQSTDGLA